MPKKLQHGARSNPLNKPSLRSSQLPLLNETDLVNFVKNKRKKTTDSSTSQLTNVITASSNQIQPQHNQLPQQIQLPHQNQLPLTSAPITPAPMQPTSSQPHLQPFIESTLQHLRDQIQREREESLPLHFQVRQLLDENSWLQQSYDRLHDDVVMNSTRPQKRVHNQVALDPNDFTEDIPFQPINNFLLRNRNNDHKVLEFRKIKPPSFTGNLKKDEYNYPTWESNAKSYLNSINAN